MKISNLFRLVAITIAMVTAASFFNSASACTGIAFRAKDGSHVIGRTMEWGTFIMENRYLVIPRGHTQIAQTPSGLNGMKVVAKYGYVAIGVLADRLVAEGLNEKGMAGELFYFPNYGKYEAYDEAKNASTIVDAQFLSWALGNFSTIAELEKAIHGIHVVGYGHGFGSAHFRLADATGRRVVIEWIDGKVCIFEEKVGVITNAPSYDWHMTNLNNYVNLFAGGVPSHQLAPGVEVKEFGIGAAALGLPGDMTPPSRFVRAAFFIHTARQQANGYDAVMQTFQILNNFDVPLGVEFSDKSKMPDMLSAAQWTSALDLTNLKFYYRSEWNSTIRCIDLKAIDFGKVKYQEADIEQLMQQPVEYIRIK